MELSDFYQKCIIGDSVESARAFPSESIHQIITVPPMGDNWSYKDRYIEKVIGVSNDWDFPALANELYRLLVPGGVLCWNVGETIDTNTHFECNAAQKQLTYLKNIGFDCHTTLIIKSLGSKIGSSYPHGFEYVFCLSKGQPRVFNRQHSSKVWEGFTRMEEDIIYSTQHGKMHVTTYHPAATRVWLIRDLMLTYSNKGDIILDPFLGSGTVLQVSREIGRNAIGMELNEEYAGLYEQEVL